MAMIGCVERLAGARRCGTGRSGMGSADCVFMQQRGAWAYTAGVLCNGERVYRQIWIVARVGIYSR